MKSSPLNYQEVTDAAPVFIKNEEAKFRRYIRQWIRQSPGEDLLGLVDQGKIRPSKALQDVLGGMLRGREEFGPAG